jgi:hypothetical protein
MVARIFFVGFSFRLSSGLAGGDDVEGRHGFGGRGGEKRLFIRRRGQVSTNFHVTKLTSYAQRLNYVTFGMLLHTWDEFVLILRSSIASDIR